MNPLAPPATPLDPDTGRRLGLYLLAGGDALERIGRPLEVDPRRRWAAAVEVLWWLAAVDDQLRAIYGDDGMRSAKQARSEWERVRHAHLEGEVLGGLMWVRHRHTHEAVDSGQGGNPVPLPMLPPGIDGPRYVVSSHQAWRPSAELQPANDLSRHLRPLYEQRVAGRRLEEPPGAVLDWLKASAPGLGIDLAAPLRADDTLHLG